MSARVRLITPGCVPPEMGNRDCTASQPSWKAVATGWGASSTPSTARRNPNSRSETLPRSRTAIKLQSAVSDPTQRRRSFPRASSGSGRHDEPVCTGHRGGAGCPGASTRAWPGPINIDLGECSPQPFLASVPDPIRFGLGIGASRSVEQPKAGEHRQIAEPIEKPSEASFLVHTPESSADRRECRGMRGVRWASWTARLRL
jgi:hypothetical protein